MKDKEKLTLEIYLLGTIKSGLKVDQIKQSIFSIFEYFDNKNIKSTYSILTLENQVTEGIGSIKNIIEIHTNNNDNFRKFNVNDEEQFSKLDILDNYDEVIMFSKYFIKYITNNKITSSLGIAQIVDYCRCEENMDKVFLNFGYKIKSKIRKDFSIYKYKNQRIYLQASFISDEEKQVSINIYELFGFCDSNEKEKLIEKMNEIKDKLSKVLVFVN